MKLTKLLNLFGRRPRQASSSTPQREPAEASAPIAKLRLTRRHDLLEFTDPDSGKYLGYVKYNAETGRLEASNGRIAISISVRAEGCPDLLVPAALVRQAFELLQKLNRGESTGEIDVWFEGGAWWIGLPGLFSLPFSSPDPSRFPEIHTIPELTADWEPEIRFTLSVEQLEHLVDYATATNLTRVRLEAKLEGRELKGIANGFRFHAFYEVFDPFVTGAMMPCTQEED